MKAERSATVLKWMAEEEMRLRYCLGGLENGEAWEEMEMKEMEAMMDKVRWFIGTHPVY